MALLIAAIVGYGFSFTIGQNLLHPSSPRPVVLYVHVALFTSWLFYFLAQAALVRSRNVRIHRRLGWLGLAMGLAIPIVGVATTIAMGRLHLREGQSDVL